MQMATKVHGAQFETIPDIEGQEVIQGQDMNFLDDIYLPVSIELGRTRMMISDIVDLDKGSIIEFDKLAGETVDLLVNDKKFAEGEVVVIDEHFGIRLTGLYKTADILKEMRK